MGELLLKYVLWSEKLLYLYSLHMTVVMVVSNVDSLVNVIESLWGAATWKTAVRGAKAGSAEPPPPPLATAFILCMTCGPLWRLRMVWLHFRSDLTDMWCMPAHFNFILLFIPCIHCISPWQVGLQNIHVRNVSPPFIYWGSWRLKSVLNNPTRLTKLLYFIL